MRKICTYMCVLLWIGVTQAGFVEEIQTLEQQSNLAQDDMYLINYYQDFLRSIEDVCPDTDIETAKIYISQLSSGLEKQYASMSIGQQLNASIELHDKLLGVQSRLNQLGGTHYCTLKYILYAMQDWLRDWHIDLMEQSGIIRDFDGFVLGGSIHGAQVKLELLDDYIAELLPYQEQLGPALEFREGDQFVTNDADREKIGAKSKQLMVLTLYKSLVELRNAGLLTDADIQELNGKFLLNMHLSCDSFHGNYKVTETLNHHGEHISYKTVEVPLDVNVCGNYFLLKELPDHFYKIVIHELGHHFYYYQDHASHANFEAICWSNNQCQQHDFVSDYARTSAIEDYAEHFMHWFLDIVPSSTQGIEKKSQHFDAFL